MTLRAGEKVREGDFINESERNADKTQDVDRAMRIEADGYAHGNFIGPSNGLLKCASVVAAGAPKILALNGDYVTLAVGAGGALAGSPDSFIGFTKAANAVAAVPSLLNEASFSDGAVDGFTANAGNRRLLVVAIQVLDGSGSGSNVSGVTADGQAMVAAGTSTGSVIGGWDSGHYGIWYLPIGDNASPDDWTIDIAYSGSPSGPSVRAFCIDNIDQINPLIYGAGYNSGSGGTLGGEFKTAGGFFVGVAQDGSFATVDGTAGPAQYKAMEAGIETISYTNGSRRVGALGVFRMAAEAVTATINVERGSFIHGFTGLTVGGKYTISTTTPGEIELDGDGPFVGFARTTTELWVFEPPKLKASGVTSFSGTGVVSIPTGFKASVIRVYATFGEEPGANSNNLPGCASWGSWNPYTGQSCAWIGTNTNIESRSGSSGSHVFYFLYNDADIHGIIQNVTDGGFEINCNDATSVNSGRPLYLHWEAEE